MNNLCISHLKNKKMSRKIVLITGTNSGFGWLTVHSVAALGHKVYATMRDTEGKNADKAQALSALENVTVLDVTLTDDKSVEQAVETIIAKEDSIDVLINNAGFSMNGVAESFTISDVQGMFDVNVFAPWRFMKQVLPAMRKQEDGLIINVTSGFGRVSFPFATVYAASKFGLEGLSEGLHYEVKRLGVDVAILEPGAFPTEMSQKTTYASDQSVFEGYGAIAEIPNKMVAALGELIQTHKTNPQDVADAIVKLITTEKGKRPLRTVVDPITGEYIDAANQAVAEQFAKGLIKFGMGELLD
ncbi:SDR family oxidoreductase [Chryseobacterium sp. JUb7]|uniref:SDR family oxidoreductase n=1 Tax=Chryseobacterium sp. JUb7 TaxID=2940599 RepID=UPI002169B975|nr:SDR family oxidoreductase [Chryseobacterium sp. JUb7]MCS3531262.1 NAD(P)-dependent dehydrogenase (short-subunit alcohol dehydrogenase family) [Chryseobacterium sp. JUb7]